MLRGKPQVPYYEVQEEKMVPCSYSDVQAFSQHCWEADRS